MWQHSWVRNGPQWHERGVNVYALVADPNSPGGVRGDEQVRSAGIGFARGRKPLGCSLGLLGGSGWRNAVGPALPRMSGQRHEACVTHGRRA